MRAQCFIAHTILSALQKSIIFKNYNLTTQEEMIHADKERYAPTTATPCRDHSDAAQ